MESQRNNENNTNNQHLNISRQRTNFNGSPPAPRASPVPRESGTAGAGLPRRRIKWTHDMNVSVLKAYYKATRTGSLTSYRQQMHTIFLNEFPQLSNLTIQNLADRRSAIVRNNLIPPTLQDEIRQSVENELNQQINSTQVPPTPREEVQPSMENERNQQNIPTQTRQIQSNLNLIPGTPTATTTELNNEEVLQNSRPIQSESQQQHYPPEDDLIDQVSLIYNEAKIKFMEMSPENRPSIPKPKCSKKLHQVTSIVNSQILPGEDLRRNNYNYIISLMYCSAYTIVHALKHTDDITQREVNPDQETPNAVNSSEYQNSRGIRRRKYSTPRWQTRLQNKIEETRKELGLITNYINGQTGRRSKNKINRIKHKHQIHTIFEPPNQTIEQIRDTIRQKLYKYTQRLRTYMKSYKRSSHNKIFNINEKCFYNSVANNVKTHVSHNINMQEIKNFWKSIWSHEIKHNLNPTWINTVLEAVAENPVMNDHTITVDVFAKAIQKLHNWKQPGCDKIHNFYYKYLTTLHPFILDTFNSMITNPSNITQGMCAGITYLKPKKDNPTSPSQYRPITCLNTGYKIFTSCISIKIGKYCHSQGIIAEEQKGCRHGTKGCKDQLIIDSVITKQAIRNRKNLYTAFIDYQKAFDSVPHSWLLMVLKIYNIDPQLIKCIEHLMGYWRTTLHVRNSEGSISSNPIKILRGIYQGDSLSPLMFCMALNPLSTLLSHSQYGYRLKATDSSRISHSFYMDDLKLYSNTKANINHLLRIVEIFSDDIRMQFGIDKCKTQNISKGKHTQSGNYNTREGSQITSLERHEHYIYLGIRQSITIDHSSQKAETVEEFRSRLRALCRTSLNGRNLVKAINTYAVSMLTYTFGILHWSTTELKDLDRMVRNTLSRYKYHHPRSATERINIPRKLGGRGILNIQILHDRQVQKLITYFHNKATTSPLYNSIVSADDNLTPLNLKNNRQINPITTRELMQSWKSKPLHGRYPNFIYHEHLDIESTTSWLRHTNIYSETEGFIIAIQDGVINTRNYRKFIMRDNTVVDDTCRRCGGASETIPHLLNGCPNLTHSHYTTRHNNMGKIVHMNVIKQLKIKEITTYYYKYTPETIIENESYIIYWDRSVLVNNPPEVTIPNRPDMLIIDKMAKTIKIIDFAVPYDNNILETINTKRTKYQPLAEYLKNTQNLHKVEIIPIVISSLGTVPLETTRSIEKLKLNRKIITDMQKSILIKATSIIRETIG